MKFCLLSLLIFWICFFCVNTHAQQQSIFYTLENDFSADDSSFADLIPLSNTSGQSGDFLLVPPPANFCPDIEDINAYHFADNAGLAFNNSDGFLDCEYTIEMLFKFDELPGLFDPLWSFVLGFQPDQDNGFYFEFNSLFGTTWDIWQGNSNLSATPYNDFSIDDWQKLTIVRNCDGLVFSYFGCTLLGDFPDANTQIFNPGDQIIFFQDDPAILASEALPGLVRNIRLSNFAMTPEEIQACCDSICEALIPNCIVQENQSALSCDINEVGIDSAFVDQGDDCQLLLITNTTLALTDTTFVFSSTCNKELAGEELSILTNEDDCDSIVFDSINWIGTDTIFSPTISITSGSTIILWGQTITEPGLYCQTSSSSVGCDSTVCQSVELFVSTFDLTGSRGLYIPNAFSPNGDGQNEFFQIYGSTEVNQIKLFQIFNRQGQLLFERKNFRTGAVAAGWDGTFRGQSMPSGVYVWRVIVGEGGEREVQKMGSFTLIR